jgi:hypothetical protein
MTRVGLQLGTSVVRAVVLDHGLQFRARTAEVPFGADRLDEAVEALRPLLGRARQIAVAVDPHLLWMKRVALPAVSAVERRNIVRLEPERFFAVRDEEIVAAVRSDDDFVFAAPASAVARWVEAIERIGPVDVIETTPAALARALATTSTRDALVFLDGGSAGVTMCAIREGRVTYARRPFGAEPQIVAALEDERLGGGTSAPMYLDPWTDDRHATLARAAVGASIEPLPPLEPRARRIPGAFAAAFGATLALERPPAATDTLLAPPHEARVRGRRIRARAISVTTFAAALLFSLASLEDRQDRTVRELDAATGTLATEAAPALAMQTELATLQRRSEAVRDIESERRHPLQIIRALSTSLPAGAFVRQIRANGADWQVDGYAPNASAVLTALGTSPGFRDVHFLSATSRSKVGNQLYESFALAFRFGATP